MCYKVVSYQCWRSEKDSADQPTTQCARASPGQGDYPQILICRNFAAIWLIETCSTYIERFKPL